MSDTKVKICGLTRTSDIAAVVDAGATYAGFVFFPKSPRNISMAKAKELALNVPTGIAKVALVVDPTNTVLDQILSDIAIDILQLHGHESPQRVADIREKYGLPVMKAIGVANESDLPQLQDYAQVADQLLVDAKPSEQSDLPGGNGLAFDWRLIADRRWPVPWMLAGGLTAGNVAEAIRLTGAQQVDVSSGVESAPGVKDAQLIQHFVTAAKAK
ncbi:phosphoribosylanthranilate isomerase [Parasulfitobacter algicola]|uniref:N-(5'-phosphoribosyl)anthranilate isomerase n=1 Tax=Parasulfitobacter algicola TaxID=2614809 RepID=A0ABX2IUW9_9RHOB|nr:phosphoribosylanthranilate isomerase [Sulfitobacter algicola]NSX56704.1 phosphoribosylanthranilate isomerase [Sulfitobacter algicola]